MEQYERLDYEIDKLLRRAMFSYGPAQEEVHELNAIINSSREAKRSNSSDLIQVGDYEILKDDADRFEELMNHFSLDYGVGRSSGSGSDSDSGSDSGSDSSSSGDDSTDDDNDDGSDEPEEVVEEEEKKEITKIEELIAMGANLTEEEKNKLLSEKEDLVVKLAGYESELADLLKLSNKAKAEDGIQSLLDNLKEVKSIEDGLDNNKVLWNYLDSIKNTNFNVGTLMGIINVSMDSANKDNLVQIGSYYILDSRVEEFVTLMERIGLNVVSDMSYYNSRKEELKYLENEVVVLEETIKNSIILMETFKRDYESGKLGISEDEFVKKLSEMNAEILEYENELAKLKRNIEIEREFLNNAKVIFVKNSDDSLKNTSELAKFLENNIRTSFNYGTLLGIVRASLEPERKNDLVKVGNYSIIASRKDEFIALMSKLGLSLGASYYDSRIEELRNKIADTKKRISEIDKLLNNKDLVEIRDAYYKIIDDVVNAMNNNPDLENLTPEQVDAKIDEMVKNHSDYSKLGKWENPVKLEKELKEDIKNKLKVRVKPRNSGKNDKLWLKALAGVGGFVTGVGLNMAVGAVPGLGVVLTAYTGARTLYQGGKLACAIATKINKGNEPKFITSIKSKISANLKKYASVAFDKPKNPYGKWFVNGMSLGYLFGQISGLDAKILDMLKSDPTPVNTVSATQNPSGVKTDWSEYNYDYEPSLAKTNWSEYNYDVSGLTTSGILKGDINLRELGFDSIFRNSDNSSWSEALQMAKDGAARLDREYINPHTGERWYHFLQKNGAGYGWLPADQVDQAINDAIIKSANSIGRRG